MISLGTVIDVLSWLMINSLSTETPHICHVCMHLCLSDSVHVYRYLPYVWIAYLIVNSYRIPHLYFLIICITILVWLYYIMHHEHISLSISLSTLLLHVSCVSYCYCNLFILLLHVLSCMKHDRIYYLIYLLLFDSSDMCISDSYLI